jgi:hypothetical protein
MNVSKEPCEKNRTSMPGGPHHSLVAKDKMIMELAADNGNFAG